MEPTSPPKGTIILTGANGGLGSAIVAKLISTPELSAHYHGIFTVRNVSSATTLHSVLKSAPATHHSDTISLDTSRLDNVRSVANAINARVAAGEIPPIRALILNAGYQEYDSQSLTEEKDGKLDMSFAANYLGHWLLTLMLLQSMDKENGRIVQIGSWSHDPYDTRNAGTGIQEPFFPDPDSTEQIAYGKWTVPPGKPSSELGYRWYSASKLCQVMMVPELQRRLDADPALSNIAILGIDPGAMPTDITRRHNFFIRFVLFKIVAPAIAPLMTWLWPNGAVRTSQKSAGDVLSAALDFGVGGSGADGKPKGLYLNGTDRLEPSEEARDVSKQRVLWRDTVGYSQIKEGETVLKEWR